MKSVVAMILAMATRGHSAGSIYKWGHTAQWSSTENWVVGPSGFDGLVDLSVDCINSFNAGAGMAVMMDSDATVGTLRMPISGKIVMGQGTTLTVTGENAATGTASWNCPQKVHDSGCTDSYLDLNGSNPSSPPCFEDTLVFDANAVNVVQFVPGQILGRVIVAENYESPSNPGTVVASWPDQSHGAQSFEEWIAMRPSQFAGPAPHIDPMTARAGGEAICSSEDCMLFCMNTCPSANIYDPELHLQFGTNVSINDINEALDNAIRERAAMGRMINALHDTLPGGPANPAGYEESFTGLLEELGIGLSGNEMISRLNWVPGIFFGWTVNVVDDVMTVVKNGGLPATLADYNIARKQASHGLQYLASLDEEPPQPGRQPSIVGAEPVMGTSISAADWMDGSGGTPVGSLALRMYIRNYLTNQRAQDTALFFDNVSATGDITSSDWRAPDTFNMSDSTGAYHHSRRSLSSAGYRNGDQMIDRVISATNAYLTSFSGPNALTQIQVSSVAAVQCGAAFYLERNIPYATGSCNFSQVRLVAHDAVVDANPLVEGPFLSLLDSQIVEAVMGMVTTEMSMYAVGVRLNESIQRTDTAWTSFAASSADDEAEFPLLIVIIAAAAVVVLVLCIVIVMLLTGGKDESKNENNRNVVAFENPMYDDPTGGNAGGAVDEADPGLYDEPAFQQDKSNPTYESNDDVADGQAGYLDVSPDDGDDDEDDEDTDDEDE